VKVLVLSASRRAGEITLGSSLRIQPIRRRRTFAGRLGIGPISLVFAWLGCLLAVLLLAPGAGGFDTPLAQAALGIALGGASGNLMDELVRKRVVDYVELGAWPAFNLADVAIVTGVALALLAR
jgi:signal peptidase II